MADETVSSAVDTFMGSATQALMRTNLGLGALATVTPGTGVATALAVNVGSAGAFIAFNGAGGTPSSLTLTSATGLPVSTGLTGTGTGVSTALAINVGSAGAFVVLGGALGTASSGNLSNCTAFPANSLGGLATGMGTFITTGTSASLASAISDETGTGALMFGTNPALVITSPATTTVGYLGVPQNSQSTAYTTVLSDAGKHIYHPGADTTARTFTIDSNANVAYPIGTALTFINDTSAGVVTIAITSDTMILAGAGTTGSRTLAASGIATAVKMTATRWIINGTGLT